MRCSFAFFAVLYVVVTYINCDVKSSYFVPMRQKTLRERFQIEDFFETNFSRFISGKVREEVESVKSGLYSNEEKGKFCLKNVTKCMENDANNYEKATKHFSNYLFQMSPPFDLSTMEGVTRQCRFDSRKFTKDLKKFKLWALQMYDASAKLPSGILNGNVNQLGDFDLCLRSNSKRDNIKGQYCLAALQIKAPSSMYMAGIHRLTHAHLAFKSKLDDPGHRVPRFSSINWAVCVPRSCSSRDVARGVKEVSSGIFNAANVEVEVKVDKEMCQSNPEDTSLPMSTILAGAFFVSIVLWSLIATAYDFLAIESKSTLLEAFSLRKNLRKLVSTERPPNDIEVVHGIRFVNAIMLLVAHKCMALFFVPYVNRTDMSEYLGKPWTVIGRAASLYTDPFIMLSGTLTAYSMFGKLQRTNRINIADEYTSRLFRILPSLAALILFCTFILPFLNTGPLWNLVVTHHAEICKQHWWRNLLFIHNYFGFKDMCLTHTHHVGIDTQLFFLSPLMVLAVWKWPKKGTVTLAVVALFSTALRYCVTNSKRLSNYIHFGTSIEQLFNTADYMYILPSHRITVYVMGILLGYVLKKFDKMHLTKSHVQLGNSIALCTFLVSFIGPSFMGSIDYVYNPVHAAYYAAFAPILWCFSFAWVIFTSHLSHGGILHKFLGWKGFLIWTRISYTVYLTQFPLFFYNVGITRAAEHYEFFRMILNLTEYGSVILLSVILTLLIEMPFINIKNCISQRRKVSVFAEDKKTS